MALRIPRSLRRAPLIEVIWQAIFDRTSPVPLGEVMLGILYADLRKLNPEWRLQRLPAAQIPPAVAEQDPNLRYVVKYRLEAENEPILYQVGDLILSVNCRQPYVGWEVFREKIIHICQLMASSALVPGPSLHALRYLDLIRKEDMSDLSGLRLHIEIGDHVVKEKPLHLRVELPYAGQNHILQVTTPARVQLKEGQLVGTLVDLETRAFSGGDWSRVQEKIDALHDASKAMFFEQVLTPKMIERFEPVYE